MDIAKLSTVISTNDLKNDFGVQMLSNSLEEEKIEGQKMVDMIEQQRMMELSVNPNIGANFDIKV